jgi:hypothetical protein
MASAGRQLDDLGQVLGSATGDQYFSTRVHLGPIVGDLAVISDGPISIQVDTVESLRSGTLREEDRTTKRVLFLIAEPVGTHLRVKFSPMSSSRDSRSSADRDGDGIVDAEMPPTVVFDGHTPREPVARSPAFATATMETSQRGDALGFFYDQERCAGKRRWRAVCGAS